MNRRLATLACAALLAAGAGTFTTAQAAPPTNDEVRDAMQRATTFFSENVSLNGGYVWVVSEDFSRRWGEVPARPSQIWLQGGTESVGDIMLDAWEATGDPLYLDVARKAADAIVYGQQPTGGWHYFIDFDPPGLMDWYRDVASRFIYGYEEYRYYYGNATYDDSVSQDAASFLLRFYNLTLEAAYRAPLLQALDFVLASQYPNGAWPQRWPLHQDPDDDRPDYPDLYTLNDGAMRANINLLLDAWSTLGDPRYLAAARRGGDALIALQGPEGQAAWPEQAGFDLAPAAARTHEPPGYVVRESLGALATLERLFLVTGDARYLAPAPGAFDWFDRINRESAEQRYPRPRYWEHGSNRPLYNVRIPGDDGMGHGLYKWSTDPSETDCDGAPCQGDGKPFVDVAPLRARYAEILSLDTAPARQAALVARQAAEHERERTQRLSGEDPAAIIAALDPRGAWTTDDIQVTKPNADTGNPEFREVVTGYSTRVFVERLAALISTLEDDNGD